MENQVNPEQKKALTAEKVINGAKTNLAALGIECRLNTVEPYEVNGQVFQSTTFDIKDKDGNWVQAKIWTAPIDPSAHIEIVKESIKKEEETINKMEADLATRKKNFEDSKLQAQEVEAKLAEYIPASNEKVAELDEILAVEA